MMRSRMKTIAILSLSTMLVPPAYAQSEVEALRERVEELENMLKQVLERLEGSEKRLEENKKKIEEEEVEIVQQSRRLDKAEEEMEQVAVQVNVQSEQIESVSQFFEREREVGFSIGDTQVSFGGYLKLDTIIASYSDGAPVSTSPGRDFYIPSTLPVNGSSDNQTVFDFNPRETRFLFTTKTPVGGHELGSRIEFDFLVTNNDNEIVSNSFVPRMRQAYLTYRGFLFGQAWTTFQDVAALPENLDFVGPTEGTTFNRQPMIRYTRGPWEFAIENPETTVTAPTGARVVADSDNLPDFAARYTYKTPLGNIKLAGLMRQLRVREGLTIPGLGVLDENQTALGIGGSLSGRLKVGDRDDIRFMGNVGQGLGRYMGIALVNGASFDENGDLDPIFIYSGFTSYRHFWTDRFRSNVTLGFFRADNQVEQTGFGVTDRVYSVHANLLYSPVPKLTLGAEYVYANRRIESGISADVNRVQFSARYGF